MKDRYSPLIVATGLTALGALFYFTNDKAGLILASFKPTEGRTQEQEEFTPALKHGANIETDLNRVVIANLATVPFLEAFDLLNAASPEIRQKWIRELDEMPESPRKFPAISSFFKTLVQINPHTAVESVTALHNPLSQSVAVQAMVRAAPLSAIEEMADLLVTIPSDVVMLNANSNLWGDVILDWSSVDPTAAARFVEMHPELADKCVETLLLNWASLNPDAARAWLEQQPKSIQSDNSIKSFLFGWAVYDQPAAMAYAVSHASDPRFYLGIRDLADNTFHRSPDEARSFLFSLPKDVRNYALSEIIEMTTGFVLGRAEEWTRPRKDVANWLLTFPEECWGSSMSELLRNWDRPDSAEMTDWLNSLSAQTHDRLVADYCSAERLDEPSRAARLGMQIKDKTLRDESLRHLLKNWLPDEREDALDVLNEAELADAERQYLISLLPKEQ